MAQMTQEETNRDIVRRYVDVVINQHNLDRLGEFFAEDGIDHAAPPGVPKGVEGGKMFLGMFFSAFPDVTYAIEDLVAEKDLITIRATLRGTHTQPFMGRPPTGRTFEIGCIETLRIVGDKYVEHWGGIDDTTMMQQLGLFEGPGSPSDKSAQYREMAVRYIEAINNDDFDLLAQIVAEDFRDQAQVSGFASGLEGAKQAHLMLRGAFPDVHFELEDVLVEGDQVVMRATGSGTHEGSFFGIGPTGKTISWTGTRILRVADGKFVEGINEFDQVGILQQMGIIPAMKPPVDLEANKAIIQRLYDEENKGNLGAIDELMASDFLMHGDALAPLTKGSAAVKGSVRAVREAFPDLVVTIENMVAQDDKVATRLRWRGTHTGAFMGLPPTNKEMTWTAIAVNRIENGKVVERWFNADTFGLLQQFGLIPKMG